MRESLIPIPSNACVFDPRQEPGALAAPAGIRAGGGHNGRPYRDLFSVPIFPIYKRRLLPDQAQGAIDNCVG